MKNIIKIHRLQAGIRLAEKILENVHVVRNINFRMSIATEQQQIIINNKKQIKQCLEKLNR